MATIKELPIRIEAQATMTLSDAEMRALAALTAYGTDSFLKWFYKDLGESCLKPHEAGLRSLFKTIDTQMPPILDRVDRSRRALEEKKA
ncbi:hypothetical protein N5B55_04880 [Ralstonia pickettii]|uniref:hypothetical protein n=1 Tax=Ralstonia pickettii TaxID=329 RepID=UPI0027153F9C|nr:hypothetical protein [Ralstonia pickettii]WKZ86288.1 hypothetical protein N5B55_04880 [Ralstonia pickettii]